MIKDIIFLDHKEGGFNLAEILVHSDENSHLSEKDKGAIVNETNFRKNFQGLKILDARKIKDLKETFSFVNVIYGAEFSENSDYFRQPNSGLDESLVQSIKEKEIIWGFCVSDILELLNNDKKRYILARLKQNYVLLKKAKVEILFFSGSNKLTSNQKNQLCLYFRHI